VYPDGSLIVELSTKCSPADVISTISDTRSFLQSRQVELSAVQATKTKTALEFFSQKLRAEQ
jgi:hypothetical protein